MEMKIKIKFLANFRGLFGGREKEANLPEGTQLRELLRILCDSPEREKQVFVSEKELNPHTVIMKNGIPVQSLGGLDTPLAEGDVIAIFPYLGGG
jgi:MoaD family protein